MDHRTSTTHRSETNDIAERVVRRVKEGASAVLLQSRLDVKWRADLYGMLFPSAKRPILLVDGKTTNERPFGEDE